MPGYKFSDYLLVPAGEREVWCHLEAYKRVQLVPWS
jgi:hypothetical protein